MAKWLRCWIPNPGVSYSKRLGDFDSIFRSSVVDKISAKNFGELSVIK